MQQPVYFLRLDLENVRCFGEKASLDLSDGNGNWRKWTVILGDNGTGKTTLLQCLALFETSVRLGPPNFNVARMGPKIDIVIDFFQFSPEKEIPINDNKISLLLNRDTDKDGVIKSDNLEIKYGKDGSIYTTAIDLSDETHIIIYGFGASRFANFNWQTTNNENCKTLFDDEAKLINAEEWLLNMDYAASRESELKDFAIKRKALIIEVLKNILPDIQDIQFTTPTKEKLTPSVEFQTEYGYWVSIHQLSLGYKTMVAWMVDLAARMFERYPEVDNPLEQPAIVLVDEIDLHLHPKWQRKIFDYLSDKFPQTQFVVTAHSPLVVQSAPKDANIVVLRKEGYHVVIDNDIKSVHNWRLDQIMSSDLFGISARNAEVEGWLEERTALIKKQTLTDNEKERLNELNAKAHALPTADSEEDIEAMDIIREAAEYLKAQKV